MGYSRLDRALWLAEKGFPIFILEPGSKRPLQGVSWYNRNSTNPDQIREWFGITPDCNYGVYPGDQYVVVDLDNKPAQNGIEEFRKICEEHEIDNFLIEINTLIVQTPTGGYHLYFRVPFPCTNRNSFPVGIDVRGANGYVVGPGSHLKTPAYKGAGHDYKVLVDEPIADAPDWILNYFRGSSRKDPRHDQPVIELDLQENIDHAIEWLKYRDPAIEGQGGDDWTFETICCVRDFGLSEGEIFRVLNLGWNERCDPPWGDAELEGKIHNSQSYAQNRPGVEAPTYKRDTLISARPAGGYAAMLTDEVIAEMFHPTRHLSLVVDNDTDSEVPEDVDDDLWDEETGELKDPKNIWYGINDFIAIKKIREYIVHHWLIDHGVTYLIAKRGTGKSTIALDLAFHVATDTDWCGIPVQKGWKVIYICGEDDEGLRVNANAWTIKHGKTALNERFLTSDDIVKLTERSWMEIRLKEMKAWAQGARCLIILDTWQRATAGWSKIDDKLMAQAMDHAEEIARELNGAMLSNVHPPKDGRMTVVGSGVQEDNSTGIWTLEQKSKAIQLTNLRAKGPGEGEFILFNMEQIEIDQEDSFGYPITGIVPIKIGGNEHGKLGEQESEIERELIGWADAIYGIEKASKQPEYDFESINLMINPIARFIAKIVADSAETEDFTDPENPRNREIQDAKRFREEHLRHLVDYLNKPIGELLAKRLSELFEVPVPPEPKTSDGQITVKYVIRSSVERTGTQKKQKKFTFEGE